jgi:ferrous iron transport protein B
VEHTLAHIEEALLHDMPAEQQRWYAVKLFERDPKVIEKIKPDREKLSHVEKDILECESSFGDDSESIITSERYDYIGTIIGECSNVKGRGELSTSDKIDRIVTNRWLALPIFALIMFGVYFVAVTSVGTIATDWANDGVFGDGWSLFGLEIPGIPVALGGALEAIGVAPWLYSLIIDGIVAGVGAVLGFVPQMLILFLLLGFLEYCGYMARIAFILDRVFRRFGLSGKSVIPILIGTGCGVPGVMAPRTIESERDRRMTVITTTFIPCGAKLPIIALIAGALFGGAWWVAPSAYFIGIGAIITSGIILKKTKMFAGKAAPFVMELPAYHMPTLGAVLRSMWERGGSFIKRAGTIILLATIFVWFTSSYGWQDGAFGSVDMDHSILAAIGSAIAWIFSPLGWGDWKAAVAAITGLIAKENVVGTFGVLYGGLDEVSEDGAEVWTNLAAAFTALSAYSFLVFNLLCAPCFAAMGAIRREMNSTKWFFTAIGYQCGFAYLIAFIVFQLGSLAQGGQFGVGTAVAIAALAGFIYMLVRPSKYEGLDIGTSAVAARA